VGYTNDVIHLGTADDTTSDMDIDDFSATLTPKEEVSSHQETATLGAELEPHVEDVLAVVEKDAVAPEGAQTFGDIESEEMDGQVGQEHGESDVLHGEIMSSGEVVQSEEDVGRMTAVEMSDGVVNIQEEKSEPSREVQQQDGEQSPQAISA
jgi:formylmethanofuran dehydrogenase subunit C